MLRAASARVAHSFRTGRQGRIAPVESLEKRTLLSAGDLDLSFGGDGRVTTDVPGDAVSSCSSTTTENPDSAITTESLTSDIAKADTGATGHDRTA